MSFIVDLHQEMSMPGFSLGYLKNLDATPIFYNAGTWSGDGTPSINEDTIYDLASVTKLYTAALILDLHQRNILDIKDKGKKYLSSFKDSNITIHDLLTHKAVFDVSYAVLREEHGSNLKNKIFDVLPPFNPSPNRHYQNATYAYLGRIVEIVTNKSLADNFEIFFAEHGLSRTYIGKVGQAQFRSPPTEITSDGIVESVTHDETARLIGGVAGHAGIFASNKDLILFGKKWLDDSIIKNDDLFHQVFQNYSEDNFYAQGLGWQNRPSYLESYNPYIFLQAGFTGAYLLVDIKNNQVASIVCNRTYAGRDNKDHKILRKALFEQVISLES
jgi:CubicO group peptidase (beta-lactamase class C family)